MNKIGFHPANLLLPQGVDMTKWCVVACDQYTSQPDYWNRVDALVGDAPSTLRITLPEIYLEEPDVTNRIDEIHKSMDTYQASVLKAFSPSFLYLERKLASGAVRRGLIGMVDLEAYDYKPGSQTLIRATEKTIVQRIPPRISVRRNAALETPHIMLLLDDVQQTVIEPLTEQKASFDKVYDFTLMENGGHLTGYLVDQDGQRQVIAALEALADPVTFHQSYPANKDVLLFAVGDGNHSLATAKAYYEECKATLPKGEWEHHPARYALVEVGNLHDPVLEFEPIHRVLFDVDPQHLLHQLKEYTTISEAPCGTQQFTFVSQDEKQTYWISNPKSNLTVGSIQPFLDDYLASHGGRIDYIHGEDVVEALGTKPGCAGFLLPPIEKSDLFKTVILDGALPRKTFSMGHAWDKRFYLECRAIQPQ